MVSAHVTNWQILYIMKATEFTCPRPSYTYSRDSEDGVWNAIIDSGRGTTMGL